MKRCLTAAVTVFLVVMFTACAGLDGAVARMPAPAATSEPPVGSPAVFAAPSSEAAPTATVIPAGDVVVVDLSAATASATKEAEGTEPPASLPAMAQVAKPFAETSATISAEVARFMVKASKYYDSFGFSSNHYKYTAAELRMLAVVIHMEARGEPYRAKLAVGNVVMNRVLARGYPGATIREVVLRPNQFCYKANVNPSAECLRAARDVLEHEAWVVPQNTYFFRSTGSRGNWGRHTYWGHLDNTAFYRDRYAGRYNGSQIPVRLYERVTRWPQFGCKPALRVRKVQLMLKSLGYSVAADGYFGAGTKKAVMKFQADNRLKVDGIAGPATLTALIEKVGLSKYLKL